MAERNGVVEREVTTRYLEMTTPSELKPRRSPRNDLVFLRLDPPWPELNRFFYTTVGANHFWVDRLPWSRAQWEAHLSRPVLETCVLTAGGLPAGYAELERQAGDDIEVAYFGLVPRFTGQGLGAHLLSEVVAYAWSLGPRRVWLHTCSLDHPSALGNYLARGFREYRVETLIKRFEVDPG